MVMIVDNVESSKLAFVLFIPLFYTPRVYSAVLAKAMAVFAVMRPPVCPLEKKVKRYLVLVGDFFMVNSILGMGGNRVR